MTPESQDDFLAAVRQFANEQTPMNFIGGATALNYGLAASPDAVDIATTGLNRIIDFPADDMTVTVETGVAKAKLDQVLAEKNLRLAIDVPHADAATLGGIVACNWNGPRRFGLGAVRDAVIGISAINGRGEPFKGGGRVVKNVAGYDFCKLLTGSLGTLAAITQLTFKLRPIAERFAWYVVEANDIAALTNEINATQTAPSAIELLSVNALSDVLETTSAEYRLAIGLEGSNSEVEWMQQQLRSEFEMGYLLEGQAASDLFAAITDFPAREAALAIRAAVLPGRLPELVSAVQRIDPNVEIVAHAGDAVAYCRFAEIPDMGVGGLIIGELQPLAEKLGGNVTMIANADQIEMTRQCVWGSVGGSLSAMQAVKDQFDPHNLLNRGRFVFA